MTAPGRGRGLRRLWSLVAGYSVVKVPKFEAPLRPSKVDEEMKALIRAAHEAKHSASSTPVPDDV